MTELTESIHQDDRNTWGQKYGIQDAFIFLSSIFLSLRLLVRNSASTISNRSVIPIHCPAWFPVCSASSAFSAV